jgi:hypothetical protein
MNLRQMAPWGQSHPDEEKGPELQNAERFLTLLVKGTALGVPEVDTGLYKDFRSQVAKRRFAIAPLNGTGWPRSFSRNY